MRKVRIDDEETAMIDGLKMQTDYLVPPAIQPVHRSHVLCL